MHFSNQEPFIKHADPILCIGSCFASHMAEKLREMKFEVMENPFGILYNPVSIARMLNRLISGERYTHEDLFEHQGLWHSFDHHGKFSDPDPQKCLDNINQEITKGQSFLNKAKYIILTLGTANAFKVKKNNYIVANCHKLPSNQFLRMRIGPEKSLMVLKEALQTIQERNPGIQVIGTISPVRHIRDGFVENQKSKATLILAVDQLVKKLDFFRYFPAYEIVMDDLRDYRFYEEDMIHPNSIAVNYIWDNFKKSFFDVKNQSLLARIEGLVKATKHRPIHAHSQEHKKFAANQLEKVKVLEEQFPFLDLKEEKALFEGYLL